GEGLPVAVLRRGERRDHVVGTVRARTVADHLIVEIDGARGVAIRGRAERRRERQRLAGGFAERQQGAASRGIEQVNGDSRGTRSNLGRLGRQRGKGDGSEKSELLHKYPLRE